MYSCRWFEHAYMHMFSGIDIHMLIHVNTDRMARACLPPSMYTCICSRALWYIYYSCIQTCICSSRVEPYTHSCSHTYGHLCSHTYKHMHMHTHTRTLVHTWVNAEIWDLVRKAMYSETRWNQKPLFGVTRRDHFGILGKGEGSLFWYARQGMGLFSLVCLAREEALYFGMLGKGGGSLFWYTW